MSFGEKVKKKENELEKTVHISFHATGEGVDLIDWLGYINQLSASETPFKITSGNVNIFYKEKSK